MPHLRERQRQRGAASDQHIIVAGAHITAGREPDDFAQPAPYPITLDRIADLPRHRESDADGALVVASACLQYERTCRRPGAARSSAKVGSARQPLHGNNGKATRSGTEPLAPMRAPRRQHLTATFGGHPGAEAVAALAHQLARLVGPFHGIGLRYRDWRGLYGTPPGPSNAIRTRIAGMDSYRIVVTAPRLVSTPMTPET
jgi:hypothetical protein